MRAVAAPPARRGVGEVAGNATSAKRRGSIGTEDKEVGLPVPTRPWEHLACYRRSGPLSRNNGIAFGT
jgi:hypothetical protein